MLALELLNSFRSQFDRIERQEMEAIDEAAEAIVESVLQEGAWHVYDTGHIIDRELVHRGGGLMFIRAFSWRFDVNDPVPACRRDRPSGMSGVKAAIEATRLAVRSSNIREGDVISIGSVSGRSEKVVELAQECRRIGCTVVAISSYEYSSNVESRHPSGKRLFECADIFIDNGAPLGDGHMDLEGYDVGVFPVSGINAAAIMWLICAQVIEKMRASGETPQVWKSVNIDGGAERNQRVEREIVDKVGY